MEGLESTDFTVKFLFAIDILNEKGIPNTAIERTLKVGRNKITNIRRGRSSADLALYSLLVKLYPEVETFTINHTTMQANAMTNTAFLNNTQRLIETQHELIEQQKKRIQELEKKLEMQETNKKHPRGGGGNY